MTYYIMSHVTASHMTENIFTLKNMNAYDVIISAVTLRMLVWNFPHHF